MIEFFTNINSLIWWPILSGLALLLFQHIPLRTQTFSYIFALLIALVGLGASVGLFWVFDSNTLGFQHTVKPIDYGFFSYHLGLDGISLALILLNMLISALVILNAHNTKTQRTLYLSLVLILSGLVNGVFLAIDMMLFYIFWELTLIPMLLIIGIWGGKARVFASMKFFIYTFFGSILMLIAMLYIWIRTHTLSIPLLYEIAPSELGIQLMLFIAFFVAFAVKIPMWPVHTWLPNAHVEAPTGGSMILAAIMLKLGGYGLVRFNLPLFPQASEVLAPIVVSLSLIAIIYIGIVALMQKDMKKMIAYSSISHMGFTTLGFFVFFLSDSFQSQVLGLSGGVIQMISHGLISAGLFFCVGMLYQRMQTKNIEDYQGVASIMPVFSALTLLFAMANSGLPGTSGFVGELMVIAASMQANFWIAFLAGLTLVIGAAYNLWLFKRVFYGEVKDSAVKKLAPITLTERFTLLLLGVLVILIGLWPNALQNMIENALPIM